MANCSVCSRVITANGRSIKCTLCLLVYHSECAGINKRIFQNFSREALRIWQCFTCKNSVYRQTAERYRCMLDTMSKHSSWHSDERTGMCENIASRVESSNQTIKHMLENYQLLVDKEQEILSEFTTRNKEMEEMKKEIEFLKHTVDNINKPAPEAMVTRICIDRISEDDPCDVFKIAEETAKAIGVAFDESKITSACYFGPIDYKVTRSVCLQFTDPKMCEEWAHKYQQVVGLTSKETLNINYDLLKKAAVEDMGATIPGGAEVVVTEADVNHLV